MAARRGLILLAVLAGTGCATARPAMVALPPATLVGLAVLEDGGAARGFTGRLVTGAGGYRFVLVRPPGLPYLAVQAGPDGDRTDCFRGGGACRRDARFVRRALGRLLVTHAAKVCAPVDPCTGPGYSLVREPPGKRAEGGLAAGVTYREEERGFRFLPSP